MKWLVLAFLVYLLVVAWVQWDVTGAPFKKALLRTFVAPWVYFFAAIPYLAYRRAKSVLRAAWDSL